LLRKGLKSRGFEILNSTVSGENARKRNEEERRDEVRRKDDAGRKRNKTLKGKGEVVRR
jgi:hypothetical protein